MGFEANMDDGDAGVEREVRSNHTRVGTRHGHPMFAASHTLDQNQSLPSPCTLPVSLF